MMSIMHWLAAETQAVRTRLRLQALTLHDLLPRAQKSPYWQWKSVWEESKDLIAERTAAHSTQTTLFFPVWGATALFNKHLESVIAHALYLRGHRVVVAGCERALPACHLDAFGNGKNAAELGLHASPTASSCVQCTWHLRKLYDASPLEYVTLSEHVQQSDFDRAFEAITDMSFEDLKRAKYLGVGVGEHAFASVCRVTGRGTLEDGELHNALLRRHVIAAMMLVDQTNRVLDAVQPNRIVLTHGIYVDHGTIAETARVRNVPVTVFVRPYRKGTVMLCHGDTYHRALITEPVDLWQTHELDDQKDAVLSAYAESRRTGSMDSITYHPSPIEDQNEIAFALGAKENQRIVSLFTNVMWDAQIYHGCNAFENMLDWVFQTIEYFADHPELLLAIRVHPAEVKATKKSLQPVATEIYRRFPRLPENVRVIEPESDLGSYDLAEMSSASIVYGTKMGLEIALRGIPVIVAGESFIRGKGFTLDASTKEEYFDILDRIPNLSRMSADEIRRARQYAYHFYFRRQIDFPFLTEEFKSTSDGIELQFSNLRALAPGENDNLDRICAGLTNGEEILAQ